MVDGVRDRPPGRTAENWSRNDRIRAGSVSGPWRSVPRTEDPVAPPHRPAESAARLDSERVAEVLSPVVVDHDPARTWAPERPHAVKRPDRDGRLAMIGWIAFGVLFAAGCVGLAFFFQPRGFSPDAASGPLAEEPAVLAAPAEQAAAPAAPGIVPGPSSAATAAAGDAAAVPAPAPSTLARVTNVRLRTGTGFADGERDAVVAALAEGGLSDVQVEALPFGVATSRVGYYRPEDQALAEALAAYIAPVLGQSAPLAVRDYGQLLDSAEPGRLDLWIGG